MTDLPTEGVGGDGGNGVLVHKKCTMFYVFLFCQAKLAKIVKSAGSRSRKLVGSR